MITQEQRKVVAITGAGSGMGEADALLLAGRGDPVVLGDLQEDRLTAVAERIRAAGGTAEHIRADVRHRADLDKLVALAVDRFGRLDVLINNAGVMPIGPLDDLDVDAWDLMIDVNVKGTSSTWAPQPPTRPSPTRPSTRARNSPSGHHRRPAPGSRGRDPRHPHLTRLRADQLR